MSTDTREALGNDLRTIAEGDLDGVLDPLFQNIEPKSRYAIASALQTWAFDGADGTVTLYIPHDRSKPVDVAYMTGQGEVHRKMFTER